MCDEIRKEMLEQRKIMEEEVGKKRKKMEEEVNKKIENERKKTETDSKNWRKVEEIVRYERRSNKEEVGKIWIELEGVEEMMGRERILKEKERKENEKNGKKQGRSRRKKERREKRNGKKRGRSSSRMLEKRESANWMTLLEERNGRTPRGRCGSNTQSLNNYCVLCVNRGNLDNLVS